MPEFGGSLTTAWEYNSSGQIEAMRKAQSGIHSILMRASGHPGGKRIHCNELPTVGDAMRKERKDGTINLARVTN